MSNWIHAEASVIGNSHIATNIPCQDYARVEEQQDFILAIVCDGAGSADNSHIGAKEVSAFAMYYLSDFVSKNSPTDLYQNLQENSLFWQHESLKIAKNIKKDIENFSINADLPLKSLACTLIMAIAWQEGILLMHIGDGRAGYCDGAGEWHALMTPFRGEEANETVFVTSDFWTNEQQIQTFVSVNVILTNPENPIKAFCLMSDGCEKASFLCNLYDEEKQVFHDPNLPYPPFFNPNLDILKNLNAQNLTQIEINALWAKFLTAGNEKLKNEPDDKTLVLVCRKS